MRSTGLQCSEKNADSVCICRPEVNYGLTKQNSFDGRELSGPGIQVRQAVDDLFRFIDRATTDPICHHDGRV